MGGFLLGLGQLLCLLRGQCLGASGALQRGLSLRLCHGCGLLRGHGLFSRCIQGSAQALALDL